MASSSRPTQGYHQDYIARIRYSNVLPPPPNPPKLLNIPGTGLGYGQYTSAGYASRLAREQPLNIETDAELGMPLDLVGLPGVFDGDESCLYPPAVPPPPHPHDKHFLKPLSALGKSSSSASSVSFLRRTEYIAPDAARAAKQKASAAKEPQRQAAADPRKRRKLDATASADPEQIANAIERSFALANPDTPSAANANGTDAAARPSQKEIEDWARPTHPTNPSLTLLDAYPVIPDLEAVPEIGSFIVTKFISNPRAGTAKTSTDGHLGGAFLRPVEPSAEMMEAHRARQLAHDADKSLPDPGNPWYEFDLFMPSEAAVAESLQGVFRAAPRGVDADPDPDAPPKDLGGRHRVPYVRRYQTYQQNTNIEQPYSDTLVLALHDPPANADEGHPLQKAAYVYPVGQRTFIRPSRAAATAAARRAPGPEVGKFDELGITVRDADEAERATLRDVQARLEGKSVVEDGRVEGTDGAESKEQDKGTEDEGVEGAEED